MSNSLKRWNSPPGIILLILLLIFFAADRETRTATVEVAVCMAIMVFLFLVAEAGVYMVRYDLFPRFVNWLFGQQSAEAPEDPSDGEVPLPDDTSVLVLLDGEWNQIRLDPDLWVRVQNGHLTPQEAAILQRKRDDPQNRPALPGA